ncbi:MULTISPECIES: restriction endonuclease subunit S [Empedobacter]|uniref:restriction endonuclease subunit S n=1 Tax=Empedobacter TaxID=59734 RepID=UPI0025776C4A|nr:MULTISPECIES: restriction endonuclease subunit S [Empedobacter]MDM1043056.1 restriction endonuclease subunit S [Empedobacter brevis]MDM1136977.1 restriction endonuclease subunit S [Empedobacter sp. R750]
MRKGWKEVTIGDLGQVVTGNTPPRKNPEYYGKHTLFVKPTDVSEGEKYTYHPDECYSELGFKKYIKSLIPKGSTCVVTIGSIGKKMTKAHCDLFINQAMNAVIPNDNFDEEFVYYVLKFNLSQLKTFDSGTASGRENVSKSSFSNIKIKVPIDKNVQQRIGEILSVYDDLIENNLKRIKILEEMAQQTYEEWFVRMRFPGQQSATINPETGLPEGWEKVKLGDIAKITFGYPFKANDFNSESKGTPIIRIRNIPKSETSDYTTEIVDDKYIVNNGDILIGMDGEFYLNFWTGNKGYLVQRVCRLVAVDYSNQGYLLEALRAPINYYQNSIDGATVAHLGKKHLDEIEIVLPNIDLSFFQNLMNQKINLSNQNQRLREARDILLPRLMMGMIEV